MTPVLTLAGVSKRFAARPGAGRRAWTRAVWDALRGRDPDPGALGRDGGPVVPALADVSLTIRRGEAVGVVGLNGAGKTTLLRLAAGHLIPDAGTVTCSGRVGTLMDLTAGFSPALTGRETIPLAAALAGRTAAEIAAATPHIEAFCGLGPALDRPVGGYSSGMALRLGFAIAAHADPDLLLVDEVLSVGDFPFRQHCLARMMVLKERAAVLLVSHNLAEVARFCDRVIVLHGGRIAFDGPTEAGLAVYRRLAEGAAAPCQDPGLETADTPAFLAPLFRDAERVGPLDLAWLDAAGRPVSAVPFGAPLTLRLRATLTAPARALFVGVPLYAPDGTRVTGLASDLAAPPLAAAAGETITVTLSLPAPCLNPGPWRGVAVLHDGPGTLARQPLPPLTVTGGPSRHWGHWTPDARWSLSGSRTIPREGGCQAAREMAQ
ncbi:ABC transporter ATP-binding protein [Roseospira navarrensis]|uniref:ATP-binding cassette domain-containing protein n=1 Tax=Roseospira navarrensis TaxID=140058 RepID=A0A7X1ZBR0_9PROT|nr:ABC transporter ATP-binding protein [Roseospira navarrensis]MQX35630.1 ATP-binding cassette domain-containing protein [Roseospira navarrensis]